MTSLMSTGKKQQAVEVSVLSGEYFWREEQNSQFVQYLHWWSGAFNYHLHQFCSLSFTHPSTPYSLLLSEDL